MGVVKVVVTVELLPILTIRLWLTLTFEVIIRIWMYQRCRLRGILTMTIDILNYSAYEIVFEYDSLRLMTIATEVLLRVEVILIVKTKLRLMVEVLLASDVILTMTIEELLTLPMEVFFFIEVIKTMTYIWGFTDSRNNTEKIIWSVTF